MDVEGVYERLLAERGVVFLLGGIDSGKTTFCRELAKRAVAGGTVTAIVDADIGHSTVGPPATVGLKLCRRPEDLEDPALRSADLLGFVGALSPKGHVTALVNATGKLVARARAEGAPLVIVDTTGVVSGTWGQLLKFYKLEVTAPDRVVAFERGGELEPVVGIAQRFTSAEVFELPVPVETRPRSADDRMTQREEAFAGYFGAGTSRWRVKPTVFMPAVPPEFDLSRFEGLLVGMEDGKGACVGIGILEFDAEEKILRMISPVTEGVRGLRLGSVRIDVEGRSHGAVTLRDLFGSE